MVVPCCRVHSVGEVSAWATQFLNQLQGANVIEVTLEAVVDHFCKSQNLGTEIPIVFVENSPDSRKWLQQIRDCGRRCFLVWYGRGFSKEELHFAHQIRVYRVFENARADDKALVSDIRRLADAVESQREAEQILHSIKATLIQEEGQSQNPAFVNEIKAAVTKLERGVLANEFHAKPAALAAATEDKIPFYKQQDFGDAMATVHDLERTGVLTVRGPLPGQEGRVEFLQGKIVAAIADRVHGLKAIYRMFLWDEPKFSFAKLNPDDLVFEEQLTLAMKYIRTEGEMLRDRFKLIRRELPPGDLRLELEPNALHGGVRLPPDDFSTLSSVVEFGNVGRILDYNPLPDVTLYEALIRLKRNQMIRVSLAPVKHAA